jgi:hypothetical protein
MLIKKSYSSDAACLPRHSGTKAGVLDCGGCDAALAGRTYAPAASALFHFCLWDASLLIFHWENAFAPFRLCVKTGRIAKRTQFQDPCVKTSPLPAGKLTQINPSGGKSKWNHTESHHFFRQTGLTLIHRLANPFILESKNPWPGDNGLSLFKPIQGYSRLFKAKNKKKFATLCPEP